ncbi:hypothetical protein [Streptomyces sp. NPDC048252]|uniref:hypothetical protein n=1 Tax=Streptomyces sp. NPDC048252 TaxID=3154612 RepID=UPI003423A6D4
MFRPGESGVPPVRPIVYHPSAEADPAAYERYADPAAAHGWENAYDETAELPRVRPSEGEPGGRADRRRAARRTAGRPSRRVLAAAGAVGAVALAAVVAGMSFSGDQGGDQRGEQGGHALGTGRRREPVGRAGFGRERLRRVRGADPVRFGRSGAVLGGHGVRGALGRAVGRSRHEPGGERRALRLGVRVREG